ncbi:MAG: hypothetical protein JXK07_02145 [Spirochaetes bacterium]|nr:hypothetical protein [Spirochaetota bacterium]MBN2771854.1 hypothetical protein [Spirochaetota bacterium]
MRKIIFLLIIIYPFFLSADDDRNNYRFSRIIVVPETENDYIEVELDQRHYPVLNGDFSDLRIVDNQGKFHPYIIQKSRQTTVKRTALYDCDLIQSGTLKRNDTLYSYNDFQITSSTDEKDLKINFINIITEKADFSVQIEIYGRGERSSWTLLAKDTIYDLQNIKKSDILFDTVSNYKFYRVLFLAPVNNITGFGLKAGYDLTVTDSESFSKSIVMNFEIEEDQKQTVITLKNTNRLNLNSLQLKCSGLFKRRYDIRSDNRTIKRGYIYSIINDTDAIEEKTISLEPLNNNEELILTIYNEDDNPLIIEEIEAFYLIDKIIFRNSCNGPLTLLFGNSFAEKPVYDMEHYRDTIENSKKTEGTLLEPVQNAEFIEVKNSGKTLFSILIVITSVIFSGGILLFLLKKK